MGALTIAFDITIVGALALAWVLLVIHLFFLEGECRLPELLDWVKDQEQPAAAAVLLFALTYTLGSAVSRIAFDFFNDDDLHKTVGQYLLRIGVTEDRIHTSAYCKFRQEPSLLRANPGDDSVKTQIAAFRREEKYCWQDLKWWVRVSYGTDDDALNSAGKNIFGLQENQLLLKGDEYTLRLRQLHDQIMVLRGAAFDGAIAFSLCLFAFAARLRRDKPRSRARLAFMGVPALYILVAFVALANHFQDRPVTDPPYMEFTLLILGVAGAWLVGKRPSPPPQPEEPGMQDDSGERSAWKKGTWGKAALFSAMITLAAALGWWSTEVSYSQQIIYSYNSPTPIPSPK